MRKDYNNTSEALFSTATYLSYQSLEFPAQFVTDHFQVLQAASKMSSVAKSVAESVKDIQKTIKDTEHLSVCVEAMQQSRQRLLASLANTTLLMTRAEGEELENLRKMRGNISYMFVHSTRW